MLGDLAVFWLYVTIICSVYITLQSRYQSSHHYLSPFTVNHTASSFFICRLVKSSSTTSFHVTCGQHVVNLIMDSNRQICSVKHVKSPPARPSASKFSHIRTRLCFWPYLAPMKIPTDDISNGSRVIMLTNRHTHKRTLHIYHPQSNNVVQVLCF